MRSLHSLLPDCWTHADLAFHVALVVGVVAIASDMDCIVRLTGLLLMAAAALQGHSILHVLRQRPRSTRPRYDRGHHTDRRWSSMIFRTRIFRPVKRRTR